MNEKYVRIFAVGLVFSFVMAGIDYWGNRPLDFTKTATYELESTEVEQSYKSVNQPVTIKKMYVGDTLIGVVSDLKYVENQLTLIGSDKYRKMFPTEKIGLSDNVYFTEDISYSAYDNQDDKIVEYLINHDLLAVEVNRIEFSNGAVIYVRDINDYEVARESFLQNFISETHLNKLKNNEIPVREKEYGAIPTALEVLEKTVESKGYASIDNILMDKHQLLEFFSYGFDNDKEYYTVEKYDTVEGVASKNGLSTQQVLTINPELESAKQLLQEGTKLNVAYFKSPLNVVVHKENVKKEIVYPDEPLYVKDNSLKEGSTLVTVKERPGSRKVQYDEVYVNGVLQDGIKEVSSQMLEEPVREVIKVGTFVEPRVGSGTFRYPVNNVSISCGWFCYAGHQAIDVQNRADFYGSVHAADRGVVVESSYTGINGNYVVVDHNNGYQTYYGHMHTAPYVSVGDVVTKGEVIGQIGMTGFATGPHVHFEIRDNGTRINPCSVLGC